MIPFPYIPLKQLWPIVVRNHYRVKVVYLCNAMFDAEIGFEVWLSGPLIALASKKALCEHCSGVLQER